jgi:hypothetical protein
MSLVRVSASFLLLASFSACVDIDDVEPDLEAETEELSRPPPPPAYTTITLYSEAGLWGTSQTVQLYRNDSLATPADPAPGPNAQHVSVQSSLRGTVSSARITCGTSATDVMFYDSDQNFWPKAAFTCRPGTTVDVNFHTTPAYPGGLTLGDRVDGLDAWLRPDVTNEYPLSQAVRGIWSDVHSQVVPSTDWYASKAKEATLYIYDPNWFVLSQEYQTLGAIREAPVWLQFYVRVMNDANGFHFQVELHNFTCTMASGNANGVISCGTTVDQERQSLLLAFQARLNTLANALPHTRNAYMYPTTGALDFGIGFVP